jgi:hypothetical protein
VLGLGNLDAQLIVTSDGRDPVDTVLSPAERYLANLRLRAFTLVCAPQM